MYRTPIVVVLGATGTGKSKLAIRIAKMFNGEIISADSMQVYEGLDIMSNKVNQSERKEIPHHLIDICKPTDQFTVLDFRKRTLPIIEDIVNRRKLPILVGGTNYYIESILWNTLMDTAPENQLEDDLCFHRRRVVKDPKAINVWKTYSCHKENTKLRKEEEENNLPVESSWFIDDLERMRSSFTESIRHIIHQLIITEPLYKRTFYKLPNFLNQTEADQNQSSFEEKDFERRIADDDSDKDDHDTIVTNVIRVEEEMMEKFMCQCVKQVILYAKEVLHQQACKKFEDHMRSPAFSNVCHPVRFWNAKKITELLAAHRSSSPYSDINNSMQNLHPEHDLCSQLEKLKEVCRACDDVNNNSSSTIIRDTLQKLRALVNEAIDMRLTRLRLIQVVDDTNMTHFSNEMLHSQLTLLDAESAKALHINNRRKVMRALAIFMSTGETMSELQKRQKKKNATLGDDFELRFPNALLLWLCCDNDVLDLRLRIRVDEMIANGLMKELEEFHKRYNLERLNKNEHVDYTKGVFQSIGLKEFHNYLTLSNEKKASKEGRVELQKAIAKLKKTNVQYSKTQYKFLKNKFVNVPLSKEIPLMFQLDCTDLDLWHEMVESKTVGIVDSYLKGDREKLLSYSPLNKEPVDTDRFLKGYFKCKLCDKTLETRFHWKQHYQSNSHRKRLYNIKVKELQRRIQTLGPAVPEKNYDIMETDDCDVNDLRIDMHS